MSQRPPIKGSHSAAVGRVKSPSEAAADKRKSPTHNTHNKRSTASRTPTGPNLEKRIDLKTRARTTADIYSAPVVSTAVKISTAIKSPRSAFAAPVKGSTQKPRRAFTVDASLVGKSNNNTSSFSTMRKAASPYAQSSSSLSSSTFSRKSPTDARKTQKGGHISIIPPAPSPEPEEDESDDDDDELQSITAGLTTDDKAEKEAVTRGTNTSKSHLIAPIALSSTGSSTTKTAASNSRPRPRSAPSTSTNRFQVQHKPKKVLRVDEEAVQSRATRLRSRSAASAEEAVPAPSAVEAKALNTALERMSRKQEHSLAEIEELQELLVVKKLELTERALNNSSFLEEHHHHHHHHHHNNTPPVPASEPTTTTVTLAPAAAPPPPPTAVVAPPPPTVELEPEPAAPNYTEEQLARAILLLKSLPGVVNNTLISDLSSKLREVGTSAATAFALAASSLENTDNELVSNTAPLTERAEHLQRLHATATGPNDKMFSSAYGAWVRFDHHHHHHHQDADEEQDDITQEHIPPAGHHRPTPRCDSRRTHHPRNDTREREVDDRARHRELEYLRDLERDRNRETASPETVISSVSDCTAWSCNTPSSPNHLEFLYRPPPAFVPRIRLEALRSPRRDPADDCILSPDPNKSVSTGLYSPRSAFTPRSESNAGDQPTTNSVNGGNNSSEEKLAQ